MVIRVAGRVGRTVVVGVAGGVWGTVIVCKRTDTYRSGDLFLGIATFDGACTPINQRKCERNIVLHVCFAARLQNDKSMPSRPPGIGRPWVAVAVEEYDVFTWVLHGTVGRVFCVGRGVVGVVHCIVVRA